MNLEVKIKHITAVKKYISDKIELTSDDLQSLKESRNGETKSTAGDKHETGRAIVQTEIDNLQRQVNKLLSQQVLIDEITTNQIHVKIGFGSLVRFDNMNYLVAAGIGNIDCLGLPKFFSISTEAPIYGVIVGKTIDDKIDFNGTKHSIEYIC